MRTPLPLTLNDLNHKTILHLLSNISRRQVRSLSNLPNLYQFGLRIEATANETLDFTHSVERGAPGGGGGGEGGGGSGCRCPSTCYVASRYINLVYNLPPTDFMELFSGARTLSNLRFRARRSNNSIPTVGFCLYYIPRNSSAFRIIYYALKSYLENAWGINENISQYNLFYHWYFTINDCVYINYFIYAMLIGLPIQSEYTEIQPYSSIGDWCCLTGSRVVERWVMHNKYSYSTDLIVQYVESERVRTFSQSIDVPGITNPLISRFIDYNSVEMDPSEYGLAIFFIDEGWYRL